MSVKNIISPIIFGLFVNFSPLSSYANNQVDLSNLKLISDELLLEIHCVENGQNNCLSEVRADKRLYTGSVVHCTNYNAMGQCTSSSYSSKYSQSAPQLLSLIYESNNTLAQQGNGVYLFTGVSNCAESSANMAYSCTVSRSIRSGEFGNYTWTPTTNTTISATFKNAPYCGVYGGEYLPGLGCYKKNTGNLDESVNRTVANLPSTCSSPDPDKNLKQACVGNPVDIVTGSKIELVQDMSFPFNWSRNYASTRNNTQFVGSLGYAWRHNYDKRLKIIDSADYASEVYYHSTLIFEQENGQQIMFKKENAGGSFVAVNPDQQNYFVFEVLDTNGSLAYYELANPNFSHELYDLNGNLINLLNRRYTLNFSYDSAQRLTRIVDTYNRYIDISYNSQNLISSVSGAGQNLVYSYTDGNLVGVTKNAVLQASYTYDSNSNLLTKTNAKGQVIGEYAYDTSSRAISSKNLSASNTYVNETNLTFSNNLITVVEAAATKKYNKVLLANGQQLINSTSYQVVGENAFNTVSIQYNSNGTIANKTDSNGNSYVYTYEGDIWPKTLTINNKITHTYTWNKAYNILLSDKQTSAGSNYTTNYYYGANHGKLLYVENISDSAGTSDYKLIAMTYDENAKMLTQTDEHNQTTTYEYYPSTSSYYGLLKKVTTPSGKWSQINSYDEKGNVLTASSFDGVSIVNTYNTLSQLTSTKETVGSMSRTTSYEYDNDNLLKKVTYPNGYIIEMTYDRLGKMLTTSDNTGESINFTYDAKGNTTNTSLYKNTNLFLSMSASYDALSRVKEQWKNLNEKHTYTYNAFRVSQEKDALNNIKNYSYDKEKVIGENGWEGVYNKTLNNAGFETKNVVNNVNTYTYSYNDFGDLKSIVNPATGTTVISEDLHAYTNTQLDSFGVNHTKYHDADGNVLWVVSAKGAGEEKVQLIYNARGLLESIVNENSRITYSYNDENLLKSKRQETATGFYTLLYGYDSVGQLMSITYPSGSIVSYTRDKGKIKSVSVNNSVGTTIVASSIEYTPLSGGVMSYSYNGQQYIRSFANGRISSITSGALNYTYGYDAGDNILSWSTGTDSNVYTYDKYKIKSKTSGALSYNYTYNSANNRITAKTPSYSTIENLNHTGDKLTSITQSGFSAINYVYDTRGNPTSIAGVNYVYNLKNKLIQIYDANNSMSYEYNGLGERISKQMNSADKTQYVYNNKKLIGEYTANGYVDYIYIGDLLVAINKDNSIFYVHNDHLNTPRKVTNTNNAVVFDWPAVDPFGANQPTINTIGFNIRYPGQYYDTETAYHYNYHRYYNPKTGKYLQSDPIGLDGGYNLYNYVDNNSLSGIDPEGLKADLNYFSYKEPQYKSAMKYKAERDWFSVAGHGSARQGIHDSSWYTQKYILEKNQNMIPISLENLAERILNHPRYRPGMGVELLGCFTGTIMTDENTQYAQKLANILRVPVRGPSDYIWFFPNGEIKINGLISDPLTSKEIIDEKRPGKFNVFYPK